MDAITVLAEPVRRRILDALRPGDRTVGQLVDALALNQPSVSKHLKVLREAGFVSRRTAAQQRVYHLEQAPLRELARWLAPYRTLG
ncbi:ArsR/SmtB family transcription factor [Actinoplanes sp. NPDC051494]|uniref:ArsR/SmtB family transcription factor n=1 Tax=Actinoplanes sp. NPDC051494 TaxID=3363907 RepID=UPI00379E8C6A